jgi:hypothetical protein
MVAVEKDKIVPQRNRLEFPRARKFIPPGLQDNSASPSFHCDNLSYD